MSHDPSLEQTEARPSIRGPVVAGIGIVVLGMQMFIIQPGFVALFVTDLGVSETMAGYIASSEMAGIALATMIAVAVGSRFSWRILGAAAAILMTCANAASAFAPSDMALLTCRGLAGLGCGLLISLGYAMIGLAPDKDRAFGYAITAVLIYGALAIFLLPAGAILLGTDGLFLLLAAASLLFFAVLPFVPAAVGEASAPLGPDADASIDPPEFAALCAVLIFFLGQGMVWAYLALIGLSHGIAEQAVSNGLTISQIAGIAGALSLVWLTTRVRFTILLAIGCAGSMVSLLALVAPVGPLQYGLSVTVFNFFANLMTAMLMAMAAKIRGDGRFVRLAAALQMIGLAAGPALSALLVADGNFASTLIIGAALFLLVLGCGIFARRGERHNYENAGIVRHINNL